MRITLRQMEVFLAVAEAGSTVAASRAMSLSQSATSAAVLELERMLKAPLFDRINKTLRLNAEGRTLLPQARALVQDARGIEQTWDALAPAVSLKLAASTTIGNYVLPQLLASHVQALPVNAQAAFRASSVRVANTQKVSEAVARGECDAGFIEGPCHEPLLHVQPWVEDELVIVASRTDPLAKKPDRRIGVRELRAAHWLLREAGSGTREAVEHALMPHLKQLNSGIEFGSSEAIKRAVAGGLGIACLSRWVVQDLLARGDIVQLTPSWPRMTRRFHIVTHGKQRSPALAGFLAHCAAQLYVQA